MYQYHIKVLKKDLSNHIILVGNPDRIDIARQFFHPITYDYKFREFRILTGYFQDEYISLISSGIGPDNTEIVLNELKNILGEQIGAILRAGTCGSISNDAKLKGFVVTEGAIRFENTSLFYVPDGYPAFSDFELFQSVIEACKIKKVPYCSGLTATFSGFYKPQGRISQYYKPPDTIKKLGELKVKNIEMETSALLSIGRFLGFKCAAICAVISDRLNDKFLSQEEIEELEIKLVEIALTAMKIHKQKSSHS